MSSDPCLLVQVSVQIQGSAETVAEGESLRSTLSQCRALPDLDGAHRTAAQNPLTFHRTHVCASPIGDGDFQGHERRPTCAATPLVRQITPYRHCGDALLLKRFPSFDHRWRS
jgi:hypothetical protein